MSEARVGIVSCSRESTTRLAAPAALTAKAAIDARRWFERLGLAALYLGVPLWLAVRIFGM